MKKQLSKEDIAALKELQDQKRQAALIDMKAMKELASVKDEPALYFRVAFDAKLRKYYEADVTPQSEPWAFLTDSAYDPALAKEIFEDKMEKLSKEPTKELFEKYAAALETFKTDEDSYALYYDIEKAQPDIKLMTAVQTLVNTKYW